MNDAELSLHFSSSTEVNVSFGGTDSGKLAFANPVTEKDRADIRWYVETYGARSLADPDDQEARRIKARLPEIGKALFRSVFDNRAAQRLFNDFQDTDSENRVLTIDAENASILSLPWELLHDPDGVFLFREQPHISIRRKISGATKGRAQFKVKSKKRLHLLFVVSRPTDAGFIDPRADSEAVLDALEKYASGRVTWEFLRPATLNALIERLDDDLKPSVDILHFDGHGVFAQVSEQDAERDPGLFGKSILSEIQRERQVRGDGAAGKPVGIGFLVFEKEDGCTHLIPAQDLADNLFRSKVGLVVLSACQTAALDAQGDPMASVAGRLTSTGIPAILAMTHAVLVPTTRMLFGKFYESLARGRGIATALDDARTYLVNNPEKYEVRRGDRRRMLELDDWFLPALFHGGADSPLLTSARAGGNSKPVPVKHNLRAPHEAGFFGRRRELWDIERWFAEETRRISLTGFGGQGKTELALEAGRWLVRTGRFARAVFVDYAQVQAADARSMAVSTMSSVFEHSLTDADAATAALRETPAIVILDNLEAVSADALNELLTAAVAWSSAGDSRVLLTSRTPDFGHPDYRIEGTRIHRRIALEGLGSAAYPEDALGWFGELCKLPPDPSVPPPTREALIELFDRVKFHPLSICVLAQQLKTRTAKQLGGRLDQILSDEATSGIAVEGTPRSLIASLQLSLERLSEPERHAVRRLGVFQGGAFEDDLLAITELGESDERKQLQAQLAALDGGDPRVVLRLMGMEIPDDAEISAELLAQLKGNPELEKHVEQLRTQLAGLPAPAAENLWPGLRRQLESAALVEAEIIPGIGPPFLRFHPTLAPMLWAGLESGERDALTAAHCRRYDALASYLSHEDRKNPHQARAIARRELPNLLHAVDRALDARDADAVEFVIDVNQFLTFFGMTREAVRLTRRAEQTGVQPGSQAWFLAQSNRGEQLLEAGRAGEAAGIFADILKTHGNQPSFNRGVALHRLGRCYRIGGRADLAEATHRQGIAVTDQLEPSDQFKQLRAAHRTELADVLTDQGKYAEARAQYELGLEIVKELNDERHQGVVLGQLGSLALQEGDLADAVKRFQEALELFQRLGEPATEAGVQHKLGLAFARARQWEQAEQHYRESARLNEQCGDLAGAAQTWNQLANLNQFAGKPEAAETWYRKAIEGGRKTEDTLPTARALSNLANLLQAQPGRLVEARQLAEEALAITKTMDPGAAEIWNIYSILAKIADQKSPPDRAAEYRRLAREAKRNFAGTAREMKRHLRVIVGTLQAIHDPGKADDFRTALSQMEKHGWTNLVAAIRRILAGERDEQALCAPLDLQDSMIIETILRAIADPSTLSALLPSDGAAK
jgi:tetratricopeptide (TPR) repeat protein